MSGRYSGPVRFFYLGDESVARQYNGIARKLVGYLQNQAQLWGDNSFNPPTRRIEITDGVIITVRKVTDLIYNAYIDARGVVAEPIIKILQYQFVYSGGAGKLWQIFDRGEDTPPYSGGSAVGVVFVIRGDRVDHVAFPLVSSLKAPNVLVPDEDWVYTPDMLTQAGSFRNALPLKRYEVAHASSQHLFMPDENNIVYAAWMPKGERHYLSGGNSVATIELTGGIERVVDEGVGFWGIYPNQDSLGFYTRYRRHSLSTDVGYETPLRPSTAPTTSLEGALIQTHSIEAPSSSPDTDWYTSYGKQTVQSSEYGERQFGVMVDAAQNIYVWPLEAAGGSIPSPYNVQSSLVNVAPEFVHTEALIFPPEVINGVISYRDNFNDPGGYFFEGPYKDATRYVWAAKHDGKRFAAILEKESPVVIPEGLFAFSPVGMNPYTIFDDPYRFADPVVGTFQLDIEITGSELSSFSVNVSPVEVQGSYSTFTPVRVGFAGDNSFGETAKGELLISGFTVHRLAEDVENWIYTIDAEALYNAPVIYRQYFNCQVINMASAPMPLSFHSRATYVDPAFGGTYNADARVPLKENFQAFYIAPRYMVQDFPFHGMRTLPVLNDSAGNVWAETLFVHDESRLRKSWACEGKFIVFNESREQVFSIVCRKYLENQPHEFYNFFTAHISDVDLSTGSIAIGLCESETTCSGVHTPATYWTPDGEPGNNALNFNTTGASGTNTTRKGFALIKNGFLVYANNQQLADQLFNTLNSPVLDKSLSFYATLEALRVVSAAFSPRAASVNHTTGFVNTEYMDNYVDSGYVSAYYGIQNFPWGKEIYSWFQARHYGKEYQNALLSCDEMISFTGAYVDYKTPVELSLETHEILNEAEVSLEEVDVILVNGILFTHAALYEEAFNEATADFNTAVESIKISHDKGYPTRVIADGGIVEAEHLVHRDIFAPMMVSQTNDTLTRVGVNLLSPQYRVYCNLSGIVNSGVNPDAQAQIRDPNNPDWEYDDGDFFDRLKQRERRGLRNTPFVARAFSKVKLDD